MGEEGNRPACNSITRYFYENPISCIAFIFSAAGAWFVASLDIQTQLHGFSLWIGSNIAWIIYGISKRDWFVVATFGIYFIFNVRGIAMRCGWCA